MWVYSSLAVMGLLWSGKSGRCRQDPVESGFLWAKGWMVAIQMVLEGNIEAFSSFSGGFWKKTECVRSGEWKGTSPRLCVAG